MLYKKLFFFCCFLSISLCVCKAQETYPTIENAIKIVFNLPESELSGAKVFISSFDSESPLINEYLKSSVTAILSTKGCLLVESDEFLVISGSFERVGNFFLFTVTCSQDEKVIRQRKLMVSDDVVLSSLDASTLSNTIDNTVSLATEVDNALMAIDESEYAISHSFDEVEEVAVPQEEVEVQEEIVLQDEETLEGYYENEINDKDPIIETPVTSTKNELQPDKSDVSDISFKKFEIGFRGGLFFGLFQQGSDLEKIEKIFKKMRYSVTPKSGVSTDFGFYFRFITPKKIGFQTELSFWTGSYTIRASSILKIKFFAEYKVIDVPIMFVYSLPISKIKLNLLAGLNFSIPQSCTWTMTGTGMNSKQQETGDSKENLILGFVVGTDCSIPISSKWGLTIGAKFLQDFVPYTIEYKNLSTEELFTRGGFICDLGIHYRF